MCQHNIREGMQEESSAAFALIPLIFAAVPLLNIIIIYYEQHNACNMITGSVLEGLQF